MKSKLLVLIPLFFLVGCNGAKTPVEQVIEKEYSVTYTFDTKLPTVHTKRLGSGSHITYLMMSPYGQIDVDGEKVKGGDYEPKFYEHCIIWESEAGAPLPAAASVSC